MDTRVILFPSNHSMSVWQEIPLFCKQKTFIRIERVIASALTSTDARPDTCEQNHLWIRSVFNASGRNNNRSNVQKEAVRESHRDETRTPSRSNVLTRSFSWMSRLFIFRLKLERVPDDVFCKCFVGMVSERVLPSGLCHFF